MFIKKPRVSLISYTRDADVLMLFTKNTRLTMNPGLMDEIKSWSKKRRYKELKYMANTIPSSWEFVDFTFLVRDVSRAFTHQCVRTRQASYAQQTMRVLEMGDFDYVLTERNQRSAPAKDLIQAYVDTTRNTYNALLSMGQPAEDARGILPTNISTNIVCKYNLRTFVDLAKSRSGGRTQNEYQCVVNLMIKEVLKVYPWIKLFLYGDKGRDYFKEIEEFAKREFPNDLKKKGELLKIVDKLRKG